MAKKLISQTHFESEFGNSQFHIEIKYNEWNKPTRAQVTSAMDNLLTERYALRHVPVGSIYTIRTIPGGVPSDINTLNSWQSNSDGAAIEWADLYRHLQEKGMGR